jgi:hypothetical protein
MGSIFGLSEKKQEITKKIQTANHHRKLPLVRLILKWVFGK